MSEQSPLIERVRAAIRRWRELDGSEWETGLSPEGTRLAQTTAADLILEGELGGEEVPRHTAIWCSSNLFTAPLEWVATLTASGGSVTLKAPGSTPRVVAAIADAFEGLPVRAVTIDHRETPELLGEVDALLAFGADSTMTALEKATPDGVPSSLHGHQVSCAVIDCDLLDTPAALREAAAGVALDHTLHDGRGCMSPVALFLLGESREALIDAIGEEMERLQAEVPRGPLTPLEGTDWRQRVGLARVLGGRVLGGETWAVTSLPSTRFEAHAPTRLVATHPIGSVDDLAQLLGDHPLSTCGTNLQGAHLEKLEALGFTRLTTPGEMQRPPLGRDHDGRDVIARLNGRG